MNTGFNIKKTWPIAITLIATIIAITLVYLELNPFITSNKNNAELEILNEILKEHDVSYKTKIVSDIELLGLQKSESIYIAYQKNNVIGVILPVSIDGYSERIDLLIGIRVDSTITGIYTKTQHETAGLGDQISQPDNSLFKQLVNQSLNHLKEEQWNVKKDNGYFDQLTGATITSRAAISAAHRAQIYFKIHQVELLRSATENSINGNNQNESSEYDIKR